MEQTNEQLLTVENSKFFISPRISRQPKDKKKLKIPQKKLKNFTQETDPKLQKTHKLTDPSREFEINENGIQKQNNRTTRKSRITNRVVKMMSR